MSDNRDSSQTLARGIRILKLIAAQRQPITVRAIATELGLSRSIVHRLVFTLQAEGLVERSPSGGYRLGLTVWTLGCAANQHVGIQEVSRPVLERLVAKTEELAHVAVLDGAEVVYIDKVDCPRMVRAYQAIGARSPAHCVSTGKAILAYLPQEQLERIAARARKYTSRTVTGKERLLEEMTEVRRRGYSVNLGEWQPDVGGVAAPIRNGSGGVIASVGVTAPLSRLNMMKVRQLGILVKTAASEISDRLKYHALLGPAEGKRAAKR